MEMANEIFSKDYSKYGFSDPEEFEFRAEKGLSVDTVKMISGIKKEPEWMSRFRMRSFEIFMKKKMPTWGARLSDIDFQNIYYYLKPKADNSNDWKDVPETIKKTFDRLGIPEAERKFLGGVGAQYE